jgi:hypothetical protein
MSDAAIRLARSYDAEPLRRELEAINGQPWIPHFSHYSTGTWSGLSLYSQGGKGESILSSRPSLEPYRETELLGRLPAFKALLDGLACPKQTVRLLALQPGGVIQRHRDEGVSFQMGMIRLHVPIVTHPEVLFLIDEQPCVWRPGELWYGDFSREHYVENKSSIVRVHLVIDVEINEFVLGLFPPDFVERMRSQGIALSKSALVEQRDEVMARFVCKFQIPPGSFPFIEGIPPETAEIDPIIGRVMHAHRHGSNGSIRKFDDRLVLLIGDQPFAALEPITPTQLAIAGMSQGVTLDGQFQGDRLSALILSFEGFDKIHFQME